jgi:hypothetical protein
MGSRLELQSILEGIIENDHVYYQPPSFLCYPCILYERNNYDVAHADDIIYKKMVRYTITVIGYFADNEKIVDKLLELQYCHYDRRFISDNLYHDVFTLYF